MKLSYLHEVLEQSALRHPDLPALYFSEATLNYLQLWQRVQVCAAELSSRFRVGDRVAVLAWNSRDYLILIYAASLARLILVPLNTRLARAEWDYQLHSTGASALFLDEVFVHRFEDMGTGAKPALIGLSAFIAGLGDTDVAANHRESLIAQGSESVEARQVAPEYESS